MTKSHIISTDNTNRNNRIVFVRRLTQFDPNIKTLIKKYIHLLDKYKVIKNKIIMVAYKSELNLKEL